MAGDPVPWRYKLDADHDNLRVAYEWFMVNDARGALRIAISLQEYWYLRNYPYEAKDKLQRALAQPIHPPQPHLRAKALSSLGRFARGTIDDAIRRQSFQEQLAIGEALDDQAIIASAWVGLGNADHLSSEEEYQQAWAYLERGHALWRSMDDTRGIADSLFGMGWWALYRGDYATSRQYLLQSLGAAFPRGPCTRTGPGRH